ncbi:MAG TPA: hypothetical protein VGJ94_04445 [Syntrophorhabdaceae bacterium]
MKRLRERKRHVIKTGLILCAYILLLASVSPASLWAGGTMKDLGTLGGYSSSGASINNLGQIAGSSDIFTDSTETRAFLYEKGVMKNLGTPAGATTSWATAINNKGQIAGTAFFPNSDPAVAHHRAFLYERGVMRDLGTLLGGSWSFAYGINDSGQIVGMGNNDDPNGYHRAFLYTPGSGMRDLGDLGGIGNTEAYGINNAGQVAGVTRTISGRVHAFRYTGGMEDLGHLGGDYSIAYGINNAGQVVGMSATASSEYHAFLYSDGEMRDLGTNGGYGSYAYAINDAGEVAGVTFHYGFPQARGFIYRNGVMKDLGSLGGSYTYGRSINNLGQIVGDSYGRAGTNDLPNHAFLWDPPPLRTAEHNLANVGTVSNQFTLWMDVSYRGRADATVCGKYKFKVVGSGFLPVEVPQASCKMVGNATSLTNAKRYSVSFTLPAPFTRAASLTDAVVYACDAKNLYNCYEIEELGKISVYGSTFDLKKQAWQVQNARWKALTTTKTTTDFYRAGDVVDDYIVADQKDGLWCAYMNITGKCTPNGLCYGLANSAISDFTNEGGATWGTDGKNGKNFDTAQWKAEIDNHWDDVLKIAQSPFKPFVTNTIYNSPETWNGVDKWTPQAAKKVLYHFVSQSSFLNGSGGGTSTNWVGRDDDTSSKLDSSLAETEVISTIQLGTPVSLGIYFAGGGGHQLAITQVLKWGGHTRYTIWDNNYPYPATRGKPYGSHFSWYVENSSDYPASFAAAGGNMFKTIRVKEGTDYGPVYTLGQVPEYLSLAGDSQNIYGTADEALAPMRKDASNSPSRPALPRYPDHVELLIVGGEVAKVTERVSGAAVSLEAGGTVSPSRGKIIEGAHGLGMSLSLSRLKTYRVSVSKYKGFPSMKVFLTIPRVDGTIEKITYDNIADAKIEFLVGETNTYLAATVSRGTRSPSYRGILPTQLPAPSDFELAYGNGSVSLTWTNTAHPRFDGVQVVRKESTLPESPEDGIVLYQGAGTHMVDSSLQKNKVYCYGVYSMNTDTPKGLSRCIDTGKYTLSGAVPGWGANAMVTLKNAQGRITHHASLSANGSYRFNNLAKGEYLIEARPDKDSEPAITRILTVERDGTMEVRELPGGTPFTFDP